MNILFISDIVPYPPDTGIKIRTYNILRQLFLFQHNVYLVAFNQKTLLKDPLLKMEYRAKLEEICEEVHILEIPSEKDHFSRYLLYLKNLVSLYPYRVQRYSSKKCTDTINDILVRVHINLCHLDKAEFFEYSKSLPDLPIFITNHNVESDLMRQRARREINLARKLFAGLQWLKTERYERLALNRSDGYLTCSEDDAHFFKTKFNLDKPYAVVANGVDCNYYRPSGNEGKGNYFLLIGAQNKESTANFDATQYFLRCIWPIVKKADPSVKIQIVGRDVDSSILEWSCRDDHIEVKGYVEDERISFSNARALIVPLRIGGGSRLKILTAFGLGTAVISTKKGAEGIAYTNGKNILIGDSPEEFAQHMLDLWQTTEKAEALGISGRKLVVEQYDWEIIGRKLADFYDSCLKLP